MSPTAKACRQIAMQLDRCSRQASFGGGNVAVTVKDPRYLTQLGYAAIAQDCA